MRKITNKNRMLSGSVLKIKQNGAYKIKDLCGGSNRKAGKYLGIGGSTIEWWLKNGIPIDRYSLIMNIFGKKIKRSEIWPEFYKDEN